MIESRTILKHQIGHRPYELSMWPDSPLPEILDALLYYKGLIHDKLEEAERQVKNEKIDEAKKDESCPEAS